MNHKFPYKWKLTDLPEIGVPYHGAKVFSCFACGGGSTLGYKLAGYNVIGCNEIDPKMMQVYKENHNPKYSFLEPIQTFKFREDLPKVFYRLDILDGSPPCSSFSMVGNREKDWGKEKKFREGQAKQVLDTLFFDFIDLAKKLQPKVVIAENVKGILLGSATKYRTNYVDRIYKAFDNAGYYCQHWLLDASKMGVPQRRERVFFITLRKDLAKPFLYSKDVFNILPRLDLNWKEKEISFAKFIDNKDNTIQKETGATKLWQICKQGHNFSEYHPKGHYYSFYKLKSSDIVPTITANPGDGAWHPNYCRLLNRKELCCAGTFPQDYNFLNNKEQYLIGMSVPPVMIAQIATKIYEQWLSKLD